MKDAFYLIKKTAKYRRWQYRRLAAQRQYGRDLMQSVPVLFGNSLPKSGSHLISQVLRGMVKLGPFVDTGFPSVNRDVANRNISDDEALKNIRRLKPGDIGYGKMACRSPFVEELTKPGVATVIMYRDPRDLAVSIIRYATEMHLEHGLHEHFTRVLKTDEERLRFVIAGSDVPDVPYFSMSTRYENYIGWLEQPVLAMRFEDLVGDKQTALGRILDFVADKGYTPSVTREQALAVLLQAIQPKRSGTFRKGQPGEWRSVFTPAIKTLFKDTTGDLLVRLGYEQDMDW